MDVRERIEPGAAHRCPYCHDLLEGEHPDDALVVCGACGTRHHAACMDELGRCTVLGCTWTPPGASGPGRSTGAQSEDELRRSIRERARHLARERARRFAQENVTPLPLHPPGWRPSNRPPPRLADRAERWDSDSPGSRIPLVIFGLVIAAGVLSVLLLVIAGMQAAIFGR